MSERPEPCVIEIVEKGGRSLVGEVLMPNEIRINGKPVLAPIDDPVIVHEVAVHGRDIVKVTLTLFARRVSIHHESSDA